MLSKVTPPQAQNNTAKPHLLDIFLLPLILLPCLKPFSPMLLFPTQADKKNHITSFKINYKIIDRIKQVTLY